MDTNLYDAIMLRKDMRTAGKTILLRLINTPGSAPSGGMVVSDTPCMVSKGDFISQLSDASLIAIAAYRQTEGGTATNVRLQHTQDFDLANPHIRNMVTILCQEGCMSTYERDMLLEKGERERSMAEEFLGRKATLSDIDEEK